MDRFARSRSCRITAAHPSPTFLKLASALPLLLTFAISGPSLGCGAEQDVVVLPSTSSSALPEVPQATVRAVTECVNRNLHGVEPGGTFAVLFDVEATRSGHVQKVKIRDSQIQGSAMESCVKLAVEEMVVPRNIMAKSTNAPVSGHDSEIERSAIGFAPAVPIIVEMVPILVKAAEVTIIVVISAIALEEIAETAKRRPLKFEKDCDNWLVQCLNYPWQPEWNRKIFGDRKQCEACYYACMDKRGNWPEDKCPHTSN